MTLLRDGERLTGTYFYPKVGKNIALGGTIDKTVTPRSASPTIAATDRSVQRQNGNRLTDSPDPTLNEIDGKWSRPDGSKETAFLVSQQPIEFTGARDSLRK